MLTIILPSIRPNGILKLYESIPQAYSGQWEIIIISPYELPKEMEGKPYVTYIQDFGNPNRCRQRALCQAKGEYTTWAVDDGFYLPESMDKAMAMLEGKYKSVMTLKYLEGDEATHMEREGYYMFDYHDSIRSLKGVPAGACVLSFGLMETALMKDLGGWSMEFESAAMADCDLSIRLKKIGCNFLISPEVCIKSTWFPGITEDHAPIHFSQIEKDEPLFRGIWSKDNDRLCVPLYAWENVPERWERRFK